MKRIAVFVGALLLGCSVEPCDRNQVTDAVGFCVAAPTGGSGGASAGADAGGAPEAGAADVGGAGSCENPTDFGDPCAGNAECHCNADYCAIQPGSSSGVCTRTGCVEDASICPEGWSCLDLAAFDPTLPSFCVPPQ